MGERVTRRGALGAGALSALVGLAGCGAENSAESTSGIGAPPPESSGSLSGAVVLWVYPMGEGHDEAWHAPHVESFQKKYPGVEVQVVVQPWESREEQLTASIIGGTAPDVVYMTPDFLPRFAAEDLLVPLDELRDNWDDFMESTLETLKFEGSLYAAPILIQAAQTFANKRILNELGVAGPTTWDELWELGEVASAAGYYAIQYSGDETLNQNYYMYLWQAGGAVLTEDNSAAAFNSPEGLEALEFIKAMNDNGWLPREPLSVLVPFEQTDLAQGNVAYSMGYMLSTARAVMQDDLEILPPMRHREQVAIGSSGALSIFRSTDSLDAAAALVHHLTEVEFIESMATDFAYYSPRTDLQGMHADDPEVAEFEQYTDLIDNEVIHPKSREIMDAMKPEIQAVLLHGKEPQDALDAMESAVNNMIARG